jgi:hypothetical protein
MKKAIIESPLEGRISVKETSTEIVAIKKQKKKKKKEDRHSKTLTTNQIAINQVKDQLKLLDTSNMSEMERLMLINTNIKLLKVQEQREKNREKKKKLQKEEEIRKYEYQAKSFQ